MLSMEKEGCKMNRLLKVKNRLLVNRKFKMAAENSNKLNLKTYTALDRALLL